MGFSIEPLLQALNVAGLAVFAASGALAAARKRLDFVGACFFALITATGGGSLRDVLIGAPVFWMQDAMPVILCLLVAIAAWAIPLRWWPERALEWLDAAGLAAYAVYGAGKALRYGVPPVPAVAAGVITACVGGIIRDITAGTPSILMRHELSSPPRSPPPPCSSRCCGPGWARRGRGCLVPAAASPCVARRSGGTSGCGRIGGSRGATLGPVATQLRRSITD